MSMVSWVLVKETLGVRGYLDFANFSDFTVINSLFCKRKSHLVTFHSGKKVRLIISWYENRILDGREE